MPIIAKQDIIQLCAALAAALIISFLATPPVKAFAKRVGAIDVPTDGRRVHSEPIPRLGGLAIFLGFLLSVVLFAEIDRQVQGILLGAIVIVVLGVIDDISPLRAWQKFIVQILAAAVAVYHGVVIQLLSNPNIFSEVDYINLRFFSIPITILWIVAVTNSVNLIDGLDGLAAGVSTIASFTMLFIALMVSDVNVAVILAALAGACLGFIPYNKNPAKIFMGDTGALLLGYLLATLSVIGLFKFYAIISFVVPVLALAMPLFDTAFAVLRRIKNGQNPMQADRGHLHHRLLDRGLNQKQAVFFIYVVSGLLGLLALVISAPGEVRILFIILAVCAAAVMGILIMKGKILQPGKGKNETDAAKEAESEIPDGTLPEDGREE